MATDGDTELDGELVTAALVFAERLPTDGIPGLIGPPLNGMGAHGRAALLAHIIDPNREVDPSFWQWNVTTRRNETLVGVMASENAATLSSSLREIPVSDAR